MKIGFLQDDTMRAMESYLTRLSKRQQVVASNVANIDTPGYRTKDVSFHATMDELLSGPAASMRTGPERDPVSELSFTPPEPEVFEERGLPMRPDRNNVDLDREMLKLAETSFGYSTTIQLLRTKFRMIATSINEGRSGS